MASIALDNHHYPSLEVKCTISVATLVSRHVPDIVNSKELFLAQERKVISWSQSFQTRDGEHEEPDNLIIAVCIVHTVTLLFWNLCELSDLNFHVSLTHPKMIKDATSEH